MAKGFNYTKQARRFSAKYPMLSFTTIQINFWVWANIIFVLIVYFSMLAIAQYLTILLKFEIWEILTISIILGAIYGFFQGTADYYVENKLIEKGNLGRYLVFKLTFSTLFSFLFFGVYYVILTNTWIPLSGLNKKLVLDQGTLKYFFIVYLIYYFIMNVLLIFINQVNKKYGPGVLLPLLLGKYSTPVEEERIFLFMDLKSSTSLAESMGHVKYSNFIRDAFLDINHMLGPYYAEVYQYVGDEIVISWPMEHSIADHAAIEFFFACENKFQTRTDHYISKYGSVPSFKAGLHSGLVTAVEIGNIKREIAYHGDILNTAARIQSLCNHYGKKLLASAYFVNGLSQTSSFQIEHLGMVNLKGKSQDTEIVGIDLISN
ncbi:adenylate/guanylate cyclase domain-containing protein [Pedobacter metabolipauper]|uniref:Adenylate cyclase n=1 Tax=Pedobacter metabolipauper TaxID=425513 RepID=A0A4V3D1M7_9SPHI|nr:adenylate/guanylate cyclase domain-containing protein [Pedobacter metabolipauper]TDQ11833.1 adenylate cyclase [Pedobacter metabolipauper]